VTKTLKSLVGLITASAGIFAGTLPILMAIIISYDVLLRYLFNAQTTWVVETTEYMVAFVILIGASYTSSQGGHVSVDFLVTRVSDKWKRVFAAVTSIINLVFITVFLWQSVLFWWEAYSLGWKSWGILSVPLAIPYAFFVLGMMFLLLDETLNLVSKGA